MDKNPFAWDNSSSDLNSKTVGLSLTDGNGKPLDLAGQQLEMFVPRNLKINPVKPMELNHFADDDPPMRVHKFNRSNLESAIAIEMKFFHPDIKFMAAVRYDKKTNCKPLRFCAQLSESNRGEENEETPSPVYVRDSACSYQSTVDQGTEWKRQWHRSGDIASECDRQTVLSGRENPKQG